MSLQYIVLILLYLGLGICYVGTYLKDSVAKVSWWQYIPIVIFWPLSLWVGFLADVYWYWQDHKKK